MKENNEVMQGDNTVGAVLNAKTKENKIQEVKQAIEKVAEKKSYKLGDEVKAYGKNCKIVEILETNRFHVKNLNSPFDSFVILESEINTDCEVLMKALDESVEEFGKERLAKALIVKDEHAPDLMVREDNRFSL